MRAKGRIQESLTLFQAATCLNPLNPANLKQVGRSLFLLGKHRGALDVYEEVQKVRKRLEQKAAAASKHKNLENNDLKDKVVQCSTV